MFLHHRVLSLRIEFFCITVVSGLVLLCCMYVDKKGYRITTVNPVLVADLVNDFHLLAQAGWSQNKQWKKVVSLFLLLAYGQHK